MIGTRKEACEYIFDRYGTKPEYLWARTPNNAVFRHGHNKKWFAAIVVVAEDKLGLPGKKPIDALLLKCDPTLKGSLIDGASVFPAYHMNKEHWITVKLGSENDNIQGLIEFSYNLTK